MFFHVSSDVMGRNCTNGLRYHDLTQRLLLGDCCSRHLSLSQSIRTAWLWLPSRGWISRYGCSGVTGTCTSKICTTVHTIINSIWHPVYNSKCRRTIRGELVVFVAIRQCIQQSSSNMQDNRQTYLSSPFIKLFRRLDPTIALASRCKTCQIC